MVYIVLLCLLLVLLIVTALVVALNLGTLLSTGVHLTVFSVHLPGIPVLLLAVLGAFLGGLALYVVALRSARRDAVEIKSLRGRIEDLEKAPTKSPSGGLSAGFAPSVVPMPGFGSGGSQQQGPTAPSNASGPFGSGGLLSNASPSSSQGPSGSSPFGGPGLVSQAQAGSQGPSGSASSPFGGPGLAGQAQAGSQGPWQQPSNAMSPSASGNTLPLPPRLFPPSPQQQQQQSTQRPPFPHS